MDRLDRIEKCGHVPFELDFLRALGFSFGEDWDGEVLIDAPEAVDVERMTALVVRFRKGIGTRLQIEGKRAMEICVGGPMNGWRVPFGGCWTRPVFFHVRRGEWAVYRIKNWEDPRAWFVGIATSKKKARALWWQAYDESRDEG